MIQAQRLESPAAILGEGPVWYDHTLYWVDIDAKRVWLTDPATGSHRHVQLEQKVGAVVPCREGGLLVALEKGFARLDPATGETTAIASPEADRQTRFNDGKCDPAGRFWAGTMVTGGDRGSGSLYVLDTDGQVHRRLTGITCSNGLAWSHDHATMYYIDTPTRQVAAFDYDIATGQIANRRPIIGFDQGQGGPDGMTIDAEGNLWIALWGGRAVVCHDPATGQRLERVELPVSRVTSCVFGGEKLDRLYITTASVGLDEAGRRQEPDAGCLFVAEVGVAGTPAMAYGA